MLDPFGTTVFDDPQYLGPPDTGVATGRIQPVGPPLQAPPDGDGNRWRGRLKHGRGIPPGQARRGGNAWQQWQQSGGEFEPGWRQKLRAMQGGMQNSVPDRGVNQTGPVAAPPMPQGWWDDPVARAQFVQDQGARFAPGPVAAPPLPQGVNYFDGYRNGDSMGWENLFYGQPSYPQRYTPMIPNEQYQAAPQFMGRQSFDPFSGPF